MYTLYEEKERLISQMRTYDRELNTEEDYENHMFNKNLEREIKRIDIAIAMADEEKMKPVQALQQALNLPCAIIEDEVLVELNGGIMHITEEDAQQHKYLFFQTRDHTYFFNEEQYNHMLETIVSFYLEKAKTEGVRAFILHYENLNNIDADLELEEKGFERHEQDETQFSFLMDAPELFSAHLPRGFYIYWL